MSYFDVPTFRDDHRYHDSDQPLTSLQPYRDNTPTYHSAMPYPGLGFGHHDGFTNANVVPVGDDESYGFIPAPVYEYEHNHAPAFHYQDFSNFDGCTFVHMAPVSCTTSYNPPPAHYDYGHDHTLPYQTFSGFDEHENANISPANHHCSYSSTPDQLYDSRYALDSRNIYDAAVQHMRCDSASSISTPEFQQWAFSMNTATPDSMHQVPAETFAVKPFVAEDVPGKALPNMGWNIAPYTDRGAEMTLVPTRTRKIVDSLESLDHLLIQLGRIDEGIAEIFMDEESALNHGREGILSTIQISRASVSGLTYILDVIILGDLLFHYVASNRLSLKNILENPRIVKVVFDLRADVAALHGQFDIVLRGGIDLQLMELGIRDQESKAYLLSLNSCVMNHLRLCAKEKAVWTVAKAGGRDYLKGDFSKWEMRPLPEPLLDYAANDTVYMSHLYAFYLSILKGDPKMMRVVLVERDDLIRQFVV
ncbi:hypothetical protein VTL71DRAFT_9282 [Oculimacula yallundae]|uniref:3'-5' exonuclease domain-containing protein n=1 Tax=Oculimacula yallundae TaxID=86028 RepID=A0ABR4BSL9_9HELO